MGAWLGLEVVGGIVDLFKDDFEESFEVDFLFVVLVVFADGDDAVVAVSLSVTVSLHETQLEK